MKMNNKGNIGNKERKSNWDQWYMYEEITNKKIFEDFIPEIMDNNLGTLISAILFFSSCPILSSC